MLEVTDGFLLMLSILLFFDSEGLLPVFLAAAALHELGHLLALRLGGGRLRRLRFSALGGRMDCVLPEGQAACFFVHAAGALMNLAAFALSRQFGASCFAGANFVLLLFNLLPIPPLDGYACLDTLLRGRDPFLLRFLSVCFALFLLLTGIYMFSAGNGISLAAAGLFLTTFSCKNLQKD